MPLPVRKSVKILLINEKKELLLMYADDPSTRAKDGSYNGPFWFTVGGEIEKGESIKEAALRELEEETGLLKNQVELGPIVWHGEFDLVLNNILTHLDQTFIVIKTTEKKVVLTNLTQWEKKTIKKLHWFSLDEIVHCKEPVFPVILPKYLPDILSENYPKTCLELDLEKQPQKITEEKINKSHLGIYAIIEKDQKILLVKKSRGPYQKMWDLPGGRPIHGETLFKTLQREVEEETGVHILDAVFHSNHAFLVDYKENEKPISLHHTCLIYKATKFDDSKMQENINEEDVLGCSWIEKSQLHKMPLSKVVLSMLA